MVYKKPKKQPQFADLKGILAQTKLDNATYQVIEGLIDRLTQFQSLIITEIENIIASVDEGKGLQGEKGPQGPQGPPGTIAAHQATHRPGGADQLVNNAWTDVQNTFNSTDRQIIVTPTNQQLELVTTGTHPGLILTNANEVLDARRARLIYHQRNLRLDFVNDPISATVGNSLTFNRDTGLLTSSGGGQFNGSVNIGADLIVNGAYKSPNNTLAMIISNNTMAMYNDGYDWVNKANTMYLMRLSSSGVLWVASTITAAGTITAPSFITDGNSNEVAKFVAPNYARAHWRNMSVAPGQQTWVIINYSGRLSIIPTTDDIGQSPANGDWNHSLSIDHDGRVFTGAGGLSVKRVIQDSASQLTWGLYIPTLVAKIANLGTVEVGYYANFSRVGNIVTVSGQFDAQATTLGVLCTLRISLPVPGNVSIAYGIVNAANGSTGRIACNGNIPYVQFDWIANNAGYQGHYYHYTYSIA